jgi:TolB-like protein
MFARRVLTVFAITFAGTYAQQSARTPSSPAPKYEGLSTLASKLLGYAESADCFKGNCKLLVSNFVLTDGHGCAYGRQLADELSTELTKQEPKIKLIDRSALQLYLEKERIPSEQSKNSVNRAIGMDLGATTVLVGTIKRLDDNMVELSARMLSVSDKDHFENSADVDLFAPSSSVDLSPSEPYAPLAPFPAQTDKVEIIYHIAPDNGVSLPRCTFMPNPPMSETSRKVGINAGILVEGVVSLNGKVEDLRVIRGLPGGLNENTLETLKTWRCEPGEKDGKPVLVVVPFEVNFRAF